MVACGLAGGVLGSLTGVIPGLHVNTLALVLLGFAATLSGWLTGRAPTGEEALLLAVLLAAAGLAHTFVNFIPATFLGAPEGETALAVLPAHKLLLAGQGYKAVVLSAMGSLAAVVWALALLLPLRWLLGEPLALYRRAQPHMFWVLAAISLLLILTEHRKIAYRQVLFKGHALRVQGRWSRWLGRAAAAGLFGLSGALGLAVWDLETTSPLGWPSEVLFPTFTGLFGAATLVNSLRNLPEVPPQRTEPVTVTAREAALAGGVGAAAGATVALLPGVTAGIGTVLAMQAHQLTARFTPAKEAAAAPTPAPDPAGLDAAREVALDAAGKAASAAEPESETTMADTERAILTLGAVNTAAAITVLAGLYILLRPRSGTAIAVNDLLNVTAWEGTLPPPALAYLLMGLLAATLVAFPATCGLARLAARLFPRLDYAWLLRSILAGLTLLVLAFTGPLGLLILVTATAVGLVAPLAGLRRSHAMGVLLVPIMVSFWVW